MENVSKSEETTLGKGEKAPGTKALLDDDIFKSPLIRARQVGVWTLYESVPTRWMLDSHVAKFWRKTRDFFDDVPFLWRFVVECFALGPSLFASWAAASIVNSFLPAVQLWLSGRVLSSIQDLAENVQGDPFDFYVAAASSIFCALMSWSLGLYMNYSKMRLSQRIKRHFENHLLRVHLRLDFQTFIDPVTHGQLSKISPGNGPDKTWKFIDTFVSMVSSVLEILSQCFVVVSVLRNEPSGSLLVVVIMARPLFQLTDFQNMPPRYYAFITNVAYKRIRTACQLAENVWYRRDILSDGLKDYIDQEHNMARAALENIPDESPDTQMNNANRPLTSFISELSRVLPAVVFGFQSIKSHGKFSIKSFTLLGDVTSSLSSALWDISYNSEELATSVQAVRTLYEAMDIPNQVVDGSTPYPLPTFPSDSGMKIEFRDVSFKYPGSSKPALKGVSFTIQAGDIVVIVGENGCGKSSTVKLLNHLYDPSEGTILIDDHPIQDFKSADIRRATAVLYQDFAKYPVTLHENIGFGAIEHIKDDERIQRAAKLSGALDFINEEALGFQTDVGTITSTRSGFSLSDKADPLSILARKMLKRPDFSGGQWQRLALAHSFMRLECDGVKFLCFDEPSAALDPRAEYELFERLRKMKGNKTMIFITHRFGHLTKYANQIFYMHQGRIQERGTHAELMEQNGEYAHLYNVQAMAYSSEGPIAEKEGNVAPANMGAVGGN